MTKQSVFREEKTTDIKFILVQESEPTTRNKVTKPHFPYTLNQKMIKIFLLSLEQEEVNALNIHYIHLSMLCA